MPLSPAPVTGSPRALLRLEGLAVLAASVAAYAVHGSGWGWFFALLLAPDLAMLGYFAGPRVGAWTYNAAHVYVLPLLLLVLALITGSAFCASAGLVWSAHVGMDRALGYGLKYPTSFHDTHLGRLGRRAPQG